MNSLGLYISNISTTCRTLWKGLTLSFQHLWDARYSRKPVGVDDESYFKQDKGIVTLQYPKESLPVPDNARYRLHNEIDDCIVCDKCAKICPVDCIDIEPIRSPEEIGKTSDGTPKRIHAAKFDIDMAKCCFCGLCTTVCPTECLTMTKAYDFSVYDVKEHNFAFAEMTPLEILEARQKLDEAEKEKAAQKAKAAEETAKRSDSVKPSRPGKPAFKPRVVPKKPTATDPNQEAREKALALKKQSAEAMKPTKPLIKPKPQADNEDSSKPRPKFRPKPVTRKKNSDD